MVKRYKFGIRVSILHTFTVLMLFSVIGATTTFYVGTSKICTELYSRIIRSVAGKIIERTMRVLEAPIGFTSAAADYSGESDIVMHHPQLWRYMWGQLMALPQISSIYVSDTRGSFVQVRRHPAPATRLIDRSISPPAERWLYRDTAFHVIRSESAPVEFDPRTREWFRAVLIAGLVTLIGLGMVHVTASWITRPIAELSKETGLIKDLRLDSVAGVQSVFREIDQMNSAFLAMKGGLESFRRYVPAVLVRQLIGSGKQAKLGGEKRDLTIMFTDITGFTPIAETMDAEALMLQLSEYLEVMTRSIHAHEGTVDKYIGDAVMAFWGAPNVVDHPQVSACRAALACQDKLTALNQTWRPQGKPAFPTAIGIHCGPVVVGNVGSMDRMNYSIIGDNVNLTSRIEGVNRKYGTGIIITQDVYEKVSERFLCRPLDIIAVKGRSLPVKIYELMAEKGSRKAMALKALQQEFQQAFGRYLDREWDAALGILLHLSARYPHDKPVKILMSRCRTLKGQSDLLGDHWDGVVKLNEK